MEMNIRLGEKSFIISWVFAWRQSSPHFRTMSIGKVVSSFLGVREEHFYVHILDEKQACSLVLCGESFLISCGFSGRHGDAAPWLFHTSNRKAE